jgi:hypothetical protein
MGLAPELFVRSYTVVLVFSFCYYVDDGITLYDSGLATGYWWKTKF